MQILVVPDSFKESLSAKEVADAIARGIHSVDPEITVKQLPFSDGGEGALDLLQNLFEGELVTTSTIDAMGRSIKAPYFRFADRKAAWIELSQASGLAQIEVDTKKSYVGLDLWNRLANQTRSGSRSRRNLFGYWWQRNQ